MFPFEILLQPKGAIPLINEHKDEIVSKVAEKTASLLPSISDVLGLKPKIAELADHLHQQALLTPDPNDDKIDFVKYLYDYVDAAPATHFAPDWFKEIIIYFYGIVNSTTHNLIQWVFKMIYEFVSTVVLWTPEWLFTGEWFSSSIVQFSAINMGIVTILTMIHGLKRMFKMKHSTLKDIMKRLPIAITVSAATPIIFTQGVKILNKITKFIINLSSTEIGANKSVDIFSTSLMMEPLNIVAMIIFLILIVYLCFPMFIFHGRRWFNLLMQGFLTPFAMSAYCFSDTEHYFHTWLNSIKDSAKKQLIYAVFISLLGLIMFATPSPTTFTGIITKMLVMVGGIQTLAYPPNIVNQLAGYGSGKGIKETYRDLKNKKDDIVNSYQKIVKRADDTAIGSARIGGKLWRLFTKV